MENIKIWKVSEGKLTHKEHEILREKKAVCIGYSDDQKKINDKRTYPSQSADFQGDISGDYFYLCYGNNGIILLGRFVDNEIIPSETYIDRKGWICRHYTIKAESKTNERYTGQKKVWTPSYDSTFKSVDSDELPLFEKEILIPFFDITLEDLEKKQNKKVTYLSEIIASLKELGGIAHIKEINRKIEDRNLLPSLRTNPNWKRVVSTTILRHYKESVHYNKSNEELFYSVEGVGKGLWGLIGYEPDDDFEEILEEPSISSYSKSEFLNDVYISEAEYDRLCNLIKHKKNIILQGAPGVGKTFAAKRLAYSIMGEKDSSRVQCVQFHQSYSYEDFIEGYRPLEENGFELRDGVFKTFCRRAERDIDKDFFFIIDEINRGNISKIFGELLMLIESDKRGNENSLKLVYSGESFSVPENVHIIGMMNTADRSLAMIDYALRRRFSFYSMKPAFDSDGFKKYSNRINSKLFIKTVEAVKQLNNVISNDKSLGKGFEIGHSYFCTDKPETITDEIVKNIITFEIIPTIEEYWFDNETTLNSERERLEALSGDDNGAV